jgi:hypothetical protein
MHKAIERQDSACRDAFTIENRPSVDFHGRPLPGIQKALRA